MDSNFVGRYFKALVDLPIYIIRPDNTFHQFETLRAGEIYPIPVYGVMNLSGFTYARFKVAPDDHAKYPGSNYTWIKFYNEQAIPSQQQYNPPPAEPGTVDKIGAWIKGLFIIAAGAYVLGKFFTKKD